MPKVVGMQLEGMKNLIAVHNIGMGINIVLITMMTMTIMRRREIKPIKIMSIHR